MIKKHALVIMAKAPLSSGIKTRLSPEYSEDERRGIYTRLLERTISSLRDIRETETMIAFTPGDSREQFVSYGLGLFAQPEGGLGQRISDAIAYALGKGHESVAVVGSDIPGLSPGIAEKAFMALREADISIGPASDGGYYLVAMKEAHEGIFEGIPWSSHETLASTLGRAGELGLSVKLIDELDDIDRPEDLSKHGGL